MVGSGSLDVGKERPKNINEGWTVETKVRTGTGGV